MTAGESAEDALFRDPLAEGFSKCVLRVAPGDELDLELGGLRDAIVVVEEGEVELECTTGARLLFGRGSMITIAQLSVAHARNIGPGRLVLVAVSRASLPGTDEFLRGSGSYVDC